MSDAVYRIVEHDGGWAYKLGSVFSETYPTRQSAEAAATRVAEEQRSPGDDESISWEDEAGRWHDEATRGTDRPNAYVAGDEAFQQARSSGRRGRRSAAVSFASPSPHREGRSESMVVMLLTIALAYILGIVVGRNA